MSDHYSLAFIANMLGGKVVGDENTLIKKVSSIRNAKQDAITFVNDSKYQKDVASSQAGAFILKEALAHLTDKPRILVSNPYVSFAKVSAFLNPQPILSIGVAQTAVVHESAHVPASCSIGELVVIGKNVHLGEGVSIGAGSIIEGDVHIASGSKLEPNVVIKYGCEIGEHCHIFSGAVIGSDGFGYAEEAGQWIKIPQVGRVIIQDHVDIGANTTIDRGALDDTMIETGVKLDNLIQIGHNCVIGAHTVIAGCVGIAGSARIGQHCKIGGAAMILGHLDIADGVTISPGTMITRSLTTADTYTALMPFQNHKGWLNTAAQLRHLDHFADRIKQLEKEITLLKQTNS